MFLTHRETCKQDANYEWRDNVPKMRADAVFFLFSTCFFLILVAKE
jgi:hypothetical protein